MITDSSGINPQQNFMQAWVPGAISANGKPTQSWPNPIYVLPATADAYEQMVEQVALSQYNRTTGKWRNPDTMKQWQKAWEGDEKRKEECWLLPARAALRAIGITAPKGSPKPNSKG